MHVSVMRPEIFMKCLVPAVFATIVVLNGLIFGFMMNSDFDRARYPVFLGAMHLGSGLVVGFGALAAGFAMGVCGEAGVRGFAQQPRVYMSMIVLLILCEVLSLFPTILAVMMRGKGTIDVTC